MLMSFCIQSQTIKNGIYYTVKKDIGFTSEIYEFKEQNSFNYLSFGCTGSGIGTGTYEVVKDSLYLSFNSLTLKKHKYLKFKDSASDSLKIDIKVIDGNENTPLPGANCLISNSNIGWQTDFDGYVSGSILKRDTTSILSISFVGFGTYDIIISPGLTEISGIVALVDVYFYGNDKEKRIKLSEACYGRIKLEYKNKKNISYRRIHRNRAFKIVKERTAYDYEYLFSIN